MTPADYTVIGAYFVGGAAAVWLHFANKAAARKALEETAANHGALLESDTFDIGNVHVTWFNPENNYRPASTSYPADVEDRPGMVTFHYFGEAVTNEADAIRAAQFAYEELQKKFRARCIVPDATPKLLDATRPPDDHQDSASASVAAGGVVVESTPTSLELKAAVDTVISNAQRIDLIAKAALIAKLGGRRCLTAFYDPRGDRC